MKLRIVVPIITDAFNLEVVKEVAQFKAPDTEIDVVNIVRGPASIESRYDEMLASIAILDAARRSAAENRRVSISEVTA